jgi:hypothetical protein
MIITLLATSFPNAAEPTAADLEFFETKVRPILYEHCFSCHSAQANHSAQAKSVKGGFLPAKAKHIIQLFMPGGPSQVDTFDCKPQIAQYARQRPSEVDRKSLRSTKD